MRTTIVLDASVILSDPHAIFKFENSDIIIPLATIEALDDVKMGIETRAINAREAIRLLDELRGDFRSGIHLENNSTIRIETNHIEPITTFNSHSADNRIISTCLGVMKRHKDQPVVLVSRDPWLRLKARVLGIETRDYKGDVPTKENLYTGHTEVYITQEELNNFYHTGILDIDKQLYPWQFVTLKSIDRGNGSGLGYFDPFEKKIKKLKIDPNTPIYGIRPRNKEQMFAFEVLLNPSIQIITINGVAGTGKNIVSIASGLELVKSQNLYDRVLLTKRTVPMGREAYEQQGFLPGDLNEKIAPWMKSYVDTIEYLHRHDKNLRGKATDELIKSNVISIEVLTYLRGRSIPKQFFIVDEAQNLDQHQVITILTRASEGTKIILMGDIHQIDTPYLDAESNGLSLVINSFKESVRAAHITLTKVERDPIVQEVIERMIIPRSRTL